MSKSFNTRTQSWFHLNSPLMAAVFVCIQLLVDKYILLYLACNAANQTRARALLAETSSQMHIVHGHTKESEIISIFRGYGGGKKCARYKATAGQKCTANANRNATGSTAHAMHCLILPESWHQLAWPHKPNTRYFVSAFRCRSRCIDIKNGANILLHGNVGVLPGYVAAAIV